MGHGLGTTAILKLLEILIHFNLLGHFTKYMKEEGREGFEESTSSTEKHMIFYPRKPAEQPSALKSCNITKAEQT